MNKRPTLHQPTPSNTQATTPTLHQTLSRFRGAGGKEETLLPQFRTLAEYLLLGGYISLGDTHRVYLRDIEFYYHEEDGPVKDPIMYHRDKKTGPVPYLPLATLYPHQSGIDITFENPLLRYRASVLVRGYNLIEADTPLPLPYETRSTYLYEALLCHQPLDLGIRLAWKPIPVATNGNEIITTVRHNVPLFTPDGHKIPYTGEGTPTANKKYLQDPRPWRFIRRINRQNINDH